MYLAPLYVGSLLIGTLLLIEYRAIRCVIKDTGRLRRIFGPSHPGHPSFSLIATRLGSRVPDFSAYEVQSGRTIDRASLLGTSTMLVFIRAADFYEWEGSVLTSFIHDCLVKVAGRVYVVFRRGDRYEQSLGIGCMRTNFEEGVVFVDDPDNRLWRTLGIEKTPCAFLLDEDGVVRSHGRFIGRETVATPGLFDG